jgi:hypothetical protein
MKNKIYQWVLIGLFVLLLALGIFSFVYSAVEQKYDLISSISAAGTFVIALLTLAYVYITSRQLDVMNEQIIENRKDRELQSQPLPWMTSFGVSIEKPKFYYSPPQKSHRTLSRYFAIFRIKNVGGCPAVSVDISAVLEIPTGDSTKYFTATSERIETLEEKLTYPLENNQFYDILFSGDVKGEFLTAIREKNPLKLPKISIRILYRNILGGCFKISNRYIIYAKTEDQDSIISDWLSSITSFNIKSLLSKIGNLIE